MEKLESMTQETALWLGQYGYKKINYPRWESIIHSAKQLLDTWRYYHSGDFYDPPDKKRAMIVIAFQPFSGLCGEWVEANLGTWASPL